MTSPAASGLQPLMESDEAGLCLLHGPAHRRCTCSTTSSTTRIRLSEEYCRDVAAGKPIACPLEYFPKDKPDPPPENRWRSHAHLLFGNWINELYQTTPFEVEKSGQRLR